MRGEFEKQVQQKMEELKLAPSTPVWEKIEMEIRPNKDRRRLLLWLPLCVLLLGGGIWWMVQDTRTIKKTTAHHQLADPAVKAIPSQAQKHIDQPESTQPSMQKAPATITLTPQLIDKIRRSNADRQRTVFNTALQQARIQRSASAAKNRTAGIHPGSNASGNATLQRSPSLSITQPGNPVPGVAKTKKPVATQLMVEKPVKVDSVLTKPVAPAPKPHSRWTLGVTAFSGLSGVSTGSSMFTKSIAADFSRVAPYSNTAVVYIPPATERNNSGFGVGLSATRAVYRRILFTTGIQYMFYSTRISVGQKINSAPMANYSAPASYQAASVPFDYYTKAINGTDYINRYHFLSIPLGLQYRLFRKTPLYLSASISAQQLISTNALQYDNQSQIYYKDNDFLKKTQVFSDFGMYYSMIRSKKLSIQLGPEFHYGITDFKKQHADNSHHVFSLGISSKILFHK